MKKILSLVFCLMMSSAAFAAGGGDKSLEKVYINLSNKEKLQDGATTFVNYCLSCHGAKYMRYNRMAKDLNLSDEVVQNNMMFTADKIGDLMEISMTKKDAEKWFGVAPPDLSLIARSKSPDYLYTFLKSFYVDKSRTTGWNNTAFPSVGMPNPLYELQGMQKANFSVHTSEDGQEHQVFEGFELQKPGLLTEQEFDDKITNLVNFMVYLGEPIILKRKTIGIWVLLFLLVLFIPCYLMKKEFWKDVH